MKIKIKEVLILRADLPLKKKFKHAITTRALSDSVFVKVVLEGGTVGYGESLPREYVTGETSQSVMDGLKKIARNNVVGYGIEDYREVSSLIDGMEIERGAARCALELALLDAYGKAFESPVSSVVGQCIRKDIYYSGVMQAGTVADAIRKSLIFKVFGFKFVKVKVGLGDDIERLRVVRKILGDYVNIRVDANCAWSADEAISRIGEMRQFGISAVEQPVKADDYHELKKVTDSVPEAIVADESLSTIDDAERLSEMAACNIFNIRLSKCGGIINSLRIADIARRNNIGIQLGCQVGESGILSAAGWHFACMSNDISFCEGAYGRYLLKKDITKEDMTIKRGGILPPVTGPGLGINVIDKALDKYIIAREMISS